jgi:hypothetical protein
MFLIASATEKLTTSVVSWAERVLRTTAPGVVVGALIAQEGVSAVRTMAPVGTVWVAALVGVLETTRKTHSTRAVAKIDLESRLMFL